MLKLKCKKKLDNVYFKDICFVDYKPQCVEYRGLWINHGFNIVRGNVHV